MKTNTTTDVRRSSRTNHTAAILAAVFAAALLPVSQAQGGPSLLTNGGFESDFTGWTASGNVRIQTSPPATEGFKHAGFNAGNSAQNGSLTQLFATTSGQVYQVWFDLGAFAYNTAQQRVRVDVIGTSGLQPVASQTVTQYFTVKGLGGGKTVWESKSFFYTANSAGATLTFRDVSPTSDAIDMLLDHVRIMPVARFPLENGSFESNFDGWSASGNVGIRNAPPYVPTDGTKLAAFNAANTAQNGMLSQMFTTIPGVEYVLSFHMGVLAYNTLEQSLQVEVTGMSNASFFKIQGLGAGKIRWERKQLTFTAQATSTKVAFWDSSTTTDSIDLLLDHVRLAANPPQKNGSFESNFDGWAASGNVEIKDAPPYVPTDGTKLAAFNTGNTTQNGVLSQTFTTIPGVTYQVSFDEGVLAYNSNIQMVAVSVTGSSGANLFSFGMAVTRIGVAPITWLARQFPFTADGTSATLSFRDISASTNSIDLLLDNVRIVPALAGLEPIPAGSFQMGDSLGDGQPDEIPVHAAYVSAFYIAKHETTKALWNAVRLWGTTRGYTDLPEGAGKGDDHPVVGVLWTDAVKWCNARSEVEGLKPCYTVSGSVYRTGSGGIIPTYYAVTNDVVCDWNANGYRLPTEAEWEKASRGGLSGKRFPWGDTITHDQANYFSDGVESYDVSPTPGYHPDYDVGASPFTSPVGKFPKNGFGLYDMAGNVFELIWDHPAVYSSSPVSEPTGSVAPLSGRALRGGSWGGLDVWSQVAEPCRVSSRWQTTGGGENTIGFRVARSVP